MLDYRSVAGTSTMNEDAKPLLKKLVIFSNVVLVFSGVSQNPDKNPSHHNILLPSFY